MKKPEGQPLTNRVPLVNLLVCVLTLISPWVTHPASSAAQRDMTVTVIVAIVAMSVRGTNYWPSVNVLLGIWLLISVAFVGGQLALMWSSYGDRDGTGLVFL